MTTPNLLQIRVSGFGGQGVVMMGYVLGKAASIYEPKNATLSQSYGPESRGGASACDVLISPDEIDYPKVTDPDVLVVLSQDAYNTYGRKRPEYCTFIVEEELVELTDEDKQKKVYKISATRMAEELGKRIVANMVMLGFVAAVTSCVGAEALKQALATTVPKGTEKLNLKAFDTGYNFGVSVRETESENIAAR
jgi:2-oxoglutarate ferredoxin oxidoreductase subunit gamma